MNIKVQYDLRRRKRQDQQATWMRTQYKNTVKVKLGDVVTFAVDPRDRCSSIPRGIIGIVAKVQTEGYGTCAIYTSHGILGTKEGKHTVYGPDLFSCVKHPTLSEKLDGIRKMILHKDFDIENKKHPIVTPATAHKLEYQKVGDRVTRGNCTCGRRNNSVKVCGNRCGCIRNKRLCTSACGCSKDCPNRK